ncbi:dynein light chain Tctex-type 5-like [Mya arenaria]|nr:dynein light chain Tctex-type 5-like [Mya arenaria]XP_052776843.1 dynein light chain Tctex-type 5-like [Mya arenaria]XP_052776844.1 dynein light chain Tctex-type 5-like [Mya arenaria]
MPPKRLTKENVENLSEKMARKSIDIGHMPQTTQPQMRRLSKWDQRIVPGVQDRRFSTASRTSISGLSHSTKPAIPVRYENTFKTDPDTKFVSHRAKSVMYETMKDWLDGMEYSANVRNLTTSLTEEIKKKVKALGFQRYKYVVTVTICQEAEQSMQMVSRCMWNKDTDTFAEVVYHSKDMHAIATLYALYFE